MKLQHRRSRLTVVCVNCKKRKIKCDKKSPCTACLKTDKSDSCVYLFDPNSHSLPYSLSAICPIDFETKQQSEDETTKSINKSSSSSNGCGCKKISGTSQSSNLMLRQSSSNDIHSYVGNNVPEIQHICKEAYSDSKHGFCSNKSFRSECEPWKLLCHHLENKKEEFSFHFPITGPEKGHTEAYTKIKANNQTTVKDLLLNDFDLIVSLIAEFYASEFLASNLEITYSHLLDNLVQLKDSEIALGKLEDYEKSLLGVCLLVIRMGWCIRSANNGLVLSTEHAALIYGYSEYARLCYELIDNNTKSNVSSMQLLLLLRVYYFVGCDVDFAHESNYEQEIPFGCGLATKPQARDFLVMDKIFMKLIFNISSTEKRIPISNLSSSWNWKQRLYQLSFSIENPAANFADSLNELERDIVAIKPDDLTSFMEWNLYVLASLFLVNVHHTAFLSFQKKDRDLSFSYLKTLSVLILHSLAVLEKCPFVAHSLLHHLLLDRVCRIAISFSMSLNSILLCSHQAPYKHCRQLFHLKTFWCDFFNHVFLELHKSSSRSLFSWRSYNSLLLCHNVIMDKSFYDILHSQTKTYMSFNLSDTQITEFCELLESNTQFSFFRVDSIFNYTYQLRSPACLYSVSTTYKTNTEFQLQFSDMIRDALCSPINSKDT